MANSITQNISDLRNLSGDPETEGFDLEAGKSWIYPTNYPIRDYQFNIVEKALYNNTLVSLPTGLGKTFIAAVVMYNFYRWYPNGKIIFMAPTRPLVKQQIDACYDIMGIPKDTTAELTGTKLQTLRSEIWRTKRVFFITPQILQNDLNNILVLAKQIKCLVFDEAHRAKGNYAYCQVIRQLVLKTKLFRVLALSATPGNSYKDIVEVVRNLQISHLEFRNEDSIDVKSYVFQRNLETVVVPLGDKLQQIRDEYIQILETYTRTLIKYRVIQGNCANLTKGKIFMVMKDFQSKNNSASNSNYNEIMKSLNICVTLYHAFELLIRHGLRGFLKFFEEHINKPLLSNNAAIINIMDNVKDYLGPEPNIEPLPDGSFIKISNQTKFGHPKFYKLRDILISHFKSNNDNNSNTSRVIVFFEFRESVTEAYALLLQATPIIRPRVFLGQKYGVTQKVQINVVKAFRDGSCNTLLSTCIGEEGLDVGDVNLIVCFDISNKSPIRMIQRMGRTGRKRDGRIIVLVTEGKEQQTLKDCLLYKNNLNNCVLNSKQLLNELYNDSARMVPIQIEPKCEKMYITVRKPEITKTSNLKDMLRNISYNKVKFPDDIQMIEIEERLKSPVQFWNLLNPLDDNSVVNTKIHFSGSLEKQRSLQPIGIVKHSKHSETLVGLLQFADSKRFNIPVTQDKGFSQMKNLKQGDIRSMFTKSNLPSLTQDLSLPEFSKQDNTVPEELFIEISNFLSIEMLSDRSCRICSKLFKCPHYSYQSSSSINLKELILPDVSLFKNITKKDLEIFAQQLTPKSQEKCMELEDDDGFNVSEIDYSIVCKEKSFAFETPKNFSKILDNLNSINKQDDIKINNDGILSFFKLQSFDDLFVTEPEETVENNREHTISPDLFENSSSPVQSNILKTPPNTPKSINDRTDDDSNSPILSSMDRLSRIQAKRKILNSRSVVTQEMKKPDLQKLHFEQTKIDCVNNKQAKQTGQHSSIYFESSNNKMGIDKSNFDIGDICDLSNFGLSSQLIKTNKTNNNLKDFAVDDVCDLSIFGLDNTNDTTKETNKLKNIASDLLDVSDICDISDFLGNKTTDTITESESNTKSNCTSIDLLNVSNVCNDKNNDQSTSVIDLTESDFVVSPVIKTSKLTQAIKTQISKINDKTPTNKTKSKSKHINKSITPKSSHSNKKSSDKKLFNIPVCSNSDDEFEESPVFIKNKLTKTTNILKNNGNNKQKKRKKLFSEFIENEAAVSDNDSVTVSEDEIEDADNSYDASFIADESHNICTQVHVEYLKSIRSPVKKPLRKRQMNISNVFSQEITNEDNAYVNDSFCVDTENVDCDKSGDGDLSELEILERKLKEQKKKRKGNKRRKIVIFSDDDSDS